jgi:hypothetical protein
MAIVDPSGEIKVKLIIVGIGDASPLRFVRDTHHAAEFLSPSELCTEGDELWQFSTMNVRTPQSHGTAVTTYLFAHEGLGFLGARTAEIKQVFTGTDGVIVLFPPNGINGDEVVIETTLRMATQQIEVRAAFDQYTVVAVGLEKRLWLEEHRLKLLQWSQGVGAQLAWLADEPSALTDVIARATASVLNRLSLPEE